jgi:hypothetical protein
MKRSDPWADKECEQCFETFSPEKRGQKLCESCRRQEKDAAERRRGRWE